MVQDAAGLQAASKGKYQYNLTDTFLLRGTTERMERYNRCEHSQVCCQAAHVYYLMQDAKLLGMLSPSSDHHECLHLSKEQDCTAVTHLQRALLRFPAFTAISRLSNVCNTNLNGVALLPGRILGLNLD